MVVLWRDSQYVRKEDKIGVMVWIWNFSTLALWNIYSLWWCCLGDCVTFAYTMWLAEVGPHGKAVDSLSPAAGPGPTLLPGLPWCGKFHRILCCSRKSCSVIPPSLAQGAKSPQTRAPNISFGGKGCGHRGGSACHCHLTKGSVSSAVWVWLRGPRWRERPVCTDDLAVWRV